MARVDNRGGLRGSARAQSGGSADFFALSRKLKTIGDGQVRKEFTKQAQAAAKPLIPQVRAAARAALPRHGGLNERIARKPLRVQARTGAATAGVRIVGTKVDPRINAGRVYHPVFGRTPGVVQRVPAAEGYFDKTLEEAGPQVSRQIADLMADYTRRVLTGDIR